MRSNQNKRMRGRNNNNNNNRKGPNPLTRSYESNGPDVKIRGTAHHVAEKYLQLARDAQSSGDPVMAESYLQHAEHYFRLIASAQQAQQQSQAGYQRQPGDPEPEETQDDDDISSIPDRFASPVQAVSPAPAWTQANGTDQPRQPYQNERPQQERVPRQDTQRQDMPRQDMQRPDRNGPERNGQDRNGQERPLYDPANGPRDNRGQRNFQPRRDQRNDQPRFDPQAPRFDQPRNEQAPRLERPRFDPARNEGSRFMRPRPEYGRGAPVPVNGENVSEAQASGAAAPHQEQAEPALGLPSFITAPVAPVRLAEPDMASPPMAPIPAPHASNADEALAPRPRRRRTRISEEAPDLPLDSSKAPVTE